ncbi:MAG TPA: NAD(P)-dependent alcohol dehydrogenase, partial [Actinomycetota bacterium]|nr:NAD(P)-dependent alcohol dehydrogenase [Actinomycetota bacterium]
MKAALCTRYGPPEVIRLAEVPTPTRVDREVLVRVHATTVNRTDCGIRAGHPWFARSLTGVVRPKVPILGGEFAGVIQAVGSGVTRFGVGDRVFGYAADGFGAHAEQLTIAEDGALATMPQGRTFEEVAPSTEGAHYAMTNIEGAGVRPGQRVLVNGGTGGIGSAAVQILKSMGAHVTAVCRGEHAELVRGLGAERIIDFTTEDFRKDDQRYDVVFDAVGKSSFGACRGLLEPHGLYLSTDL